MRIQASCDSLNVVRKHEVTPEPTPPLLLTNKFVQTTAFTMSAVTLLHFTASSRNAAPLAERGLSTSARPSQRFSEAP